MYKKFDDTFIFMLILHIFNKIFYIHMNRTSNDHEQFTILNENDELETIQFSTDEMLETLQLEDSTV